MEVKVSELEQTLEALRNDRAEKSILLKQLDDQVHEKRKIVDQVVEHKSELDVKLAEERMRYQTLTERVTSEWKLSVDEIRQEQDPDWGEEGQPDRETIETTVGELRTKLDSLGPVNLVAIEEHKELEERYAFLNKEEEDLLNAKQQLMEMIKTINSKTTEMFTETFNAVNGHFQEIFKNMFGGGSAKLVLLDEEDVLESGIEIIARPPGKKLQTVSLLSGGERTMTAVALLFSLYTVKPSPFCVLDELDAALDDANIGRFVTMVEGFVEGSQFIVITHNRQTISAADVLYGITMDRGVSGIISARFKDHEEHVARDETTKPAEEAADKA